MLSSGTWIVGVGLVVIVVIVLVLTESLVIPVVVTGARGRGGVHAYHLYGLACWHQGASRAGVAAPPWQHHSPLQRHPSSGGSHSVVCLQPRLQAHLQTT
jgi:hypothetical protein